MNRKLTLKGKYEVINEQNYKIIKKKKKKSRNPEYQTLPGNFLPVESIYFLKIKSLNLTFLDILRASK